LNSGDITYYVVVGLVLLYFTRQVLGAVGFRIYWGGFAFLAVVIGYFTLKYCINWDAVTTLADIGTVILIGAAVIVGAGIVVKLFGSAGREWMYEDNMARWRRRWRDSRRHWWHFL